MAQVIDRRVTAEIEDDFVVFLIGMRINKLWKMWKWLPVFFAMPRMLRELEQRPESGFLGASGYAGSPRRPMLVQYWRSFEDLETYARSKEAAHWPAWVKFNKRVGSSGDVGIWHETYLVPAGGYECVYNNMPPMGLGAVTRLVPAAGRKAAAASRAGVRDEAYPEGASTGRIEV
jgi:fumigallin biosynthesis monooxygenase-like protein